MQPNSRRLPRTVASVLQYPMEIISIIKSLSHGTQPPLHQSTTEESGQAPPVVSRAMIQPRYELASTLDKQAIIRHVVLGVLPDRYHPVLNQIRGRRDRVPRSHWLRGRSSPGNGSSSQGPVAKVTAWLPKWGHRHRSATVSQTLIAASLLHGDAWLPQQTGATPRLSRSSGSAPRRTDGR